MVDFKPVGEVADARSTWIWRAIGVGDDHYSMASVDEFLHTSRLAMSFERIDSIIQ